MPRTAREKSESGIYHIMLRGINRQNLFQNDYDCEKFLETIGLYQGKSGYRIYAYCLMSNHVHILLKEEQEPLATIVKRISSSYVYYYNKKYDRCGHLFQERFKSEVVEDENYLLMVLRYIHQNPVEAKIVQTPEEYKWSSYREYLSGDKIINTDFVLGLFSPDRNIAVEKFISFNKERSKEKCLEHVVSTRINDVEAREIIKKLANVEDISQLQTLEKETKNEIIRKIKEVEGISIRQIARITGLSYSLVLKV